VRILPRHWTDVRNLHAQEQPVRAGCGKKDGLHIFRKRDYQIANLQRQRANL